MRILQIGPVPPEAGGRTSGGIATQVWDLSRRLVRRGHAVGILASNRDSNGVHPCTVEGVSLWGTPHFAEVATVPSLAWPASWERARRMKQHFGPSMTWPSVVKNLLVYERIVNAFQPDVIHVRQLLKRFPPAHFAADGRVPVVTTVHSTSSIDPGISSLAKTSRDLDSGLVRRNLRLATDLIFVSRFVRKRMTLLYPGALEPLRLHTVLNPVDTGIFTPGSMKKARKKLGLSDPEKALLFVGGLIQIKRPDLLLRALANLEGAHLLMVGDGPMEPSLRDLARELRIQDRVRFEGRRPRGDLPDYYRAVDCMVLPSEMEGLPNAVLEALSCGCPVVGTPETMNDMIDGGRCGLYVSSGTPDRLGEGIRSVLSRDWDREAIRRHAESFDWDRAIEKLMRAYRAALG